MRIGDGEFQTGDRVNFISCRDGAGPLAEILGTVHHVCGKKTYVKWDTCSDARAIDTSDLYLVERPVPKPGRVILVDNIEDGFPRAVFSPRFLANYPLPLDSAGRKDVPLWRGLLRYFPSALALAARISKHGNDKHNAGEPMHHARGKSNDHADCVARHLVDLDVDYGRGVGYDEDGVPQVGYIVWRALALAQEWLETHEDAPRAPGASAVDK